ncbi:MAG: exopolysaccharide biosynthesis polyprenyl glycosylphosphotransferase [Bacteroidia bacterium]
MSLLHRKRYSLPLARMDLALVTLAYAVAYYLRFGEWQHLFSPDFVAFWGILLLLWLTSALLTGLYERAPSSDPFRRLSLWFRCFVLFAVTTYAFNGLIKVYYSRILITLMLAVTANLQILWHWFLPVLLRRSGFHPYRGAKAILLGPGIAEDFERINRKTLQLFPQIVGYFGPETEQHTGSLTRLGGSDEWPSILPDLLRTETISDIYCSSTLPQGSKLEALSRLASEHLVNLHLVPDTRMVPLGRIEMDYLGHLPIWSLRPFALETENAQRIKRAVDILFSLAVLVLVLSWLVPLVALLIRLDSSGPVFFVQWRSGKDNRPFRCYKFRSMKLNEEADTLQARADDARITRMGRFLRNTSMDELPQFWNVLKGEMSVVGPRPHMLSHTLSYSQVIERFMARHRVKPGITGLSQAMGYRGETRAKQDMKNRVRLDLLYIQNWSLGLDLKIIGMTAATLLRSLRNGPEPNVGAPNAE